MKSQVFIEHGRSDLDMIYLYLNFWILMLAFHRMTTEMTPQSLERPWLRRSRYFDFYEVPSLAFHF